MASAVYQFGLTQLLDGTVGWVAGTFKIMLHGTATAYTLDQDQDFVSSGAGTVGASELSGVSGYTGGFAGAGRKTLAGKAVNNNDTNNRVEITCSNITWTALGTGGTIAAGVVIREVTNDAASPLYFYLDVTDTPTNGSDITFTIASNGIANLNT